MYTGLLDARRDFITQNEMVPKKKVIKNQISVCHDLYSYLMKGTLIC